MSTRELGFISTLVIGTLLVVIFPLITSIGLLGFFFKRKQVWACVLHCICAVISLGIIVYVYLNPLASPYVAAITPLLAISQLLLARFLRATSQTLHT
jgi:hypothetical protein